MIYRSFNEEQHHFRSGLNADMGFDTSSYSNDPLNSMLNAKNGKVTDKKLRAILESEDIVKDFNSFVISLVQQTTKEDSTSAKVFKNNVSRIASLLTITFEDAWKLCCASTFPEYLTPEGIKLIINTRLEINKRYSIYLHNMVIKNYRLLEISKESAMELQKSLRMRSDSARAREFIQDVLNDPKIMKKFRTKRGLYDLSKIGGGFITISEEMENDEQFTRENAIGRNLIKLFDFDAVVSSHGSSTTSGYVNKANTEPFKNHVRSDKSLEYGDYFFLPHDLSAKDFDRKTIEEKEVLYFIGCLQHNKPVKAGLCYYILDNESNIDQISKILNIDFSTFKAVKDFCYLNSNSIKQIRVDTNRVKQFTDSLIDFMVEFINKVKDFLISIDDDNKYILTDYSYSIKNCMDICNYFLKRYGVGNSSEVASRAFERYSDIRSFKNALEGDRKRGFGSYSGEKDSWTIQAVNTRKANNITNVVELLKQLKKEGCRKIWLCACNPDSFKIPDEVTEGLEVYYGDNCVYGESYSIIKDIEIFNREIEMIQEQVVLTEGPIDFLRDFFDKAIDIVKRIWEKIKDFFALIFRKIKEFFVGDGTTGGSSIKDVKLSNKIKVTFIAIENGQAKIIEKEVDTLDEAQKISKDATESLGKFINKESANQQNIIDKLKKEAEKKQQQPGQYNPATNKVSEGSSMFSSKSYDFFLEAEDNDNMVDYTKEGDNGDSNDNDANGNPNPPDDGNDTNGDNDQTSPAEDSDNMEDYTKEGDNGDSNDNDQDSDQGDDNSGDNQGNDNSGGDQGNMNPDDGNGGGDQGGSDGGGDQDGGDDYGSDDDSDDQGGDDDYGSDDGGDDDSDEIKSLQKDIFSNLTPQQMAIKNKELKGRFFNIYDNIGDMVNKINDIPKPGDIIKPIEFVSRKLDELSDMINDYINYTYDTLTYVENEINYQKFFTILSGLSIILKDLAEMRQKENK